MRVERKIPPKLAEGILSGTYKIFGGIIKNVINGQIVGHLQIPTKAALTAVNTAVPGMLSSLGMATTALGAVNLGVTIAGFIIVCKKLNKMNEKLQQMDSKLDALLDNQNSLIEHNQRLMRTNLSGALISLESAVNMAQKEAAIHTFIPINQTVKYYSDLTYELIVKDEQRAYLDSELIQTYINYVITAKFAILHALALFDEESEAKKQLSSLRQWHDEVKKVIYNPFKTKKPPTWLVDIYPTRKVTVDKFIQTQNAIPDALSTFENQLQLSIDGLLPYKMVANDVSDLPFVILSDEFTST